MDRRTLLKGLAALAPVMGVRSVLADHHKKGSLPAKTCRLITQDITGPYMVDETLYPTEPVTFPKNAMTRDSLLPILDDVNRTFITSTN